MRTGDGNESDKAVWRQILSNVKKQIKLDSIPHSALQVYYKSIFKEEGRL